MQVIARRLSVLAIVLAVVGCGTGAAPLVLFAGAIGLIGLCAFVAAVRG